MTRAEGTDRHFAHTLETTAPDAVWRLWTEVTSWAEWDLGLVAADLDGPLRPGAVGTLVPAAGPRSRFTVTAMEQGRRTAFETALPGARLRVDRHLSADRRRFTHAVSFSGPLAWLFAPLLAPKLRMLLPPTMARLKAIAERDA